MTTNRLAQCRATAYYAVGRGVKTVLILKRKDPIGPGSKEPNLPRFGAMEAVESPKDETVSGKLKTQVGTLERIWNTELVRTTREMPLFKKGGSD